MKIQEIRRNGSKYYHIYLPKNIIENVLNWKGKDNLVYHVVNNTLVLRKEIQHSNEWQDYLTCKACNDPTISIKIIKNPLRNQYSIVARCPSDHTILKTSLESDSFDEWKSLILSQIYICDICGGNLFEETRKFVRSNLGFRVRLRLFCRDCGRHRIKVLAQEIWDELHIQESPPTSPQPLILHNNHNLLDHDLLDHETPENSPKHCPTCEEPNPPAQPFCGQCGTCLIK